MSGLFKTGKLWKTGIVKQRDQQCTLAFRCKSVLGAVGRKRAGKNRRLKQRIRNQWLSCNIKTFSDNNTDICNEHKADIITYICKENKVHTITDICEEHKVYIITDIYKEHKSYTITDICKEHKTFISLQISVKNTKRLYLYIL